MYEHTFDAITRETEQELDEAAFIHLTLPETIIKLALGMASTFILHSRGSLDVPPKYVTLLDEDSKSFEHSPIVVATLRIYTTGIHVHVFTSQGSLAESNYGLSFTDAKSALTS